MCCAKRWRRNHPVSFGHIDNNIINKTVDADAFFEQIETPNTHAEVHHKHDKRRPGTDRFDKSNALLNKNYRRDIRQSRTWHYLCLPCVGQRFVKDHTRYEMLVPFSKPIKIQNTSKEDENRKPFTHKLETSKNNHKGNNSECVWQDSHQMNFSFSSSFSGKNFKMKDDVLFSLTFCAFALTDVSKCYRSGKNIIHMDDIRKKGSLYRTGGKRVIEDQKSITFVSAKRFYGVLDHVYGGRNNSIDEAAHNMSSSYCQRNKSVPRWYGIFNLLIFICFLSLSGVVVRAESFEYLYIDPVETPIYFFTNVTLTCNISETARPGNLVWYKLPKVETLAVNEFPRNLTKYSVNMYYSQSRTIYQLTIKTFDSSDVDCTYRCDSGFYSDMKSLHLNAKEYIAMPADENIQIIGNITDHKVNVRVLIQQVYPAPVCSVMFQEQNLTNKIQVTNEEGSPFFKTTLKLENITVHCRGEVKFVCFIGMMQKIISATFGECDHSDDLPRVEYFTYVIVDVPRLRTTTQDVPRGSTTSHGTDTILIIIPLVVLACIVVIILCVVVRCLFKRKNQKHNADRREEIGINLINGIVKNNN